MHNHKVILMILCLCLTACSAKKQHTEQVPTEKDNVSLARIAKKNKLYGASIRLYGKALELHPNDPVLLFEQGEAFALSGQCQRAAKIFSENSVATSNPVQISKSLGKCFLLDEDFEQALAVLSSNAQRSDNDPQYMNLLGTAYSFSGKTTKARASLNSALKLAPDDMEIMNNLAVVDIIEGKYETAIRELSRLLRRGYNTPRIRHNLALAYGLADRMEQAEKLYGIDLSQEQVKKNIEWYRQFKKNSSIQ